jgi:hypothetical protein
MVQVDHLADDNMDHYLEKINKIIHLAAQESIPRTPEKRSLGQLRVHRSQESQKESLQGFPEGPNSQCNRQKHDN